MSEPMLGAVRQSFAHPPPAPPHDAFYSTASSANVVQPSPISPRPSSSFSSYGAPYPEHQRESSGASLSDPYGHPSSGWTGMKHSELEQDATLASSPLSPLYDGSVASGSDASVTGLPSPPAHARPSPAKQLASIPAMRPSPNLQAPLPGAGASATPRGGGPNSKTYSFVSLAGNAVKKRPRRRYDEIERLYQCSWPNCTKAYGTLNHLNAHVTMQRHGAKRSPNEFKDLRKKWRQEKKEAEEAEREREREQHAQALAMREMQMSQMSDYEQARFAPRRRVSMAEPYSDHHLPSGPQSLPNHSYMHSAMQGSYLQQAGMAVEGRYGLSSPVEEYRYSHPTMEGLPSLTIPQHSPEEEHYYRQTQQPTPHGELGWSHPHPSTPHSMRSAHAYYNTPGSIILPPPHTLGGLSSSAPTPSPLSAGPFTPLAANPTPSSLSGAAPVSLSISGAVAPGHDSGSATPELAAHVSLGSNRLPPDSTLLTPLPGYEPDIEHHDGRERERERDRDFGRERGDDRWGSERDRERYYTGNGQGAGREHHYE
ncbi:uncharacterized protein BXZ73DRAFT_75354 [Epithele typhae]|uniref:uncharacterized protein n=1 Tax=Epithele typhae TaxID=378194 RepID=UPI002007E08E|nr:uncharacterized protein BXZ73DRAFT_75354 [Epithele typhae]KAH9940812.1 hypothetical protein BXZ73DRAFT_75354 [Epithele typhae]